MPHMMLSGFLIIDKPSGVTSFSMVALVRRLSGVKRVGHAGTLDPLASGVLPVAVGHATRFIEYMDDAPKTYRATVRFGSATDTYDAEGAVTATGNPSGLTADRVRGALPAFIGEVSQTPPAYSAIKVAGKPLYRYAREGTKIEVAPRLVRIDSIDLLRFEAAAEGSQPPPVAVEAELDVVCGKGTYIRSLAHDLGQLLGCGAHLAALRRTSSGSFSIDEAHAPDELTAAARDGSLVELMLATDRAVEPRPAAILDAGSASDVRAGRDLRFAGGAGPEHCRAYSISGDFLGVLRSSGAGRWHPEKVVPAA